MLLRLPSDDSGLGQGSETQLSARTPPLDNNPTQKNQHLYKPV